MGYAGCAFVAVEHNDRQHQHVHLVVSRVRSDSSLAREQLGDFQKAMAVCRQLEREFGLRRLEAFTPDVLVLDLRLPDTDGIALLQTIRRSHPTLPVVVTTAYVSMEPLISVLKLEHSAYLVKPYDLNDLAARIDAAS